MIDIDITNRQTAMPVDERQLDRAARLVLADHGPRTVEVSVAVVDNPMIHELNRRFLEHDYPTDVLSFVLEDQPERLEGDVIISADMAAAEAGAHDMSPENELLLYLIHGILHLVGFDDKTPAQSREMRSAEQRYLEQVATLADPPDSQQDEA